MPVTCRHVNDLRDAYLDGDLSSHLTAEVHAHLLQCPACQQDMELLRACGEVIALDQDAPALDAGFASRVVANLPKPAVSITPVTRQDIRRRYWHVFAGAGLPAAAAIVFLCVLVWPAPRPPEGIVLPATHEAAARVTGVVEIVNPAIGTLQGTRDAIRDVTDTVVIGMNEAGRELTAHGEPEVKPVSLLDVLLSPFSEALTPISGSQGTPAADDGTEAEVVRF